MGDGYLTIEIDGRELRHIDFAADSYEVYIKTDFMHEVLRTMKESGLIKMFILKGYKCNYKERVRGRGIQYIPDDILIAESNDTMERIITYINPNEWG